MKTLRSFLDKTDYLFNFPQRDKLKEINLSKEELHTYRRFQENLMFEADIATIIRF